MNEKGEIHSALVRANVTIQQVEDGTVEGLTEREVELVIAFQHYKHKYDAAQLLIRTMRHMQSEKSESVEYNLKEISENLKALEATLEFKNGQWVVGCKHGKEWHNHHGGTIKEAFETAYHWREDWREDYGSDFED